MVMVQDENDAKCSGMPRSAISTGLVDYVLPVDKMPQELLNYTRHAILEPRVKRHNDRDDFQRELQKIFILLRSHTNHDFSLYKKNTITRRIERRMHVHQIDDIKDYVAYLQRNDREVFVLFKDLLIGVTSFFRDPEAFNNLRDNFLTKLIQGKPENSPLRVWVAGCSTGEEAYSMAIMLQEIIKQSKKRMDVQIFGTDIDEDAINTARAGLYPLSVSADITPERLKRFFIREESHFRVSKTIREMLVFAPQNIIKDPPFTKLDVLCCRNLLIYLGPELQKNLFPIFHYSLKPDGILFLGSSESIGRDVDLFKIEDKKWKIFRRLSNPSRSRPLIGFSPSTLDETTHEIKTTEVVKRAEEINNFMLVETILKQSDTPPCAIIDDKLNLVYTHGRTGKYLEPAIGKVSVNILEMARPGLKAVLASAIRKVQTHKREVVHNGVEIQNGSTLTRVNLTVKPVHEFGTIRSMIMVVFRDVVPLKGEIKEEKSENNNAVTQLEQELRYTRENLQTTIEELETSNEELKSANEELQSTNEELQSTNEELIDEFSNANDDMKNLLDSTEIDTIFLDIDLNVRRFTPLVTRLVPLAVTDIGRPFIHFSTKFKAFDIVEHAKQVLKDLITQEFEIQTEDKTFFLIRIMPYRTMHNVIDGVVITFKDITEFKRFRFTGERLAEVMESKDAMIVQDAGSKIIFWSRGAERLYGFDEKSALTMDIRDLVPGTKKEEFNSFLARVRSGNTSDTLETERITLGGDILKVRVMAVALRDEKDHVTGIITVDRPVS